MTSRRAWGATVGLVVLVGLAVILGSALTRPGSSSSASPASPLVGHKAPPLAGKTLSGGHYELDASSAPVTLVNIWASWCGPCKDELPLIASTAKRWSRSGARVVTVNTKDGPVAARSLLQEVNATNLLAVEDPQGKLAVSWGATGIPETFVVDHQGIVRARWTGPVTRAWLDAQLKRWGRS